MKKIAVTFILVTSFFTILAQKPTVTRAYNFYYEKDFVKAKSVIDRCVEDEKMSNKATTWLYKANIDYFLANEEYGERQRNENYVVRFPQTPIEAYEAFQKAKSLNKNVMATGMLSPDEALPQLYSLLFISGVDQLIEGNFEKAKLYLEKGIESYEMSPTPVYPLQGEIYYYYAYTLEMLGDKLIAKQNYEKAIADSSQNSNVYLRLIAQYKEEQDRDAMKTIIDKGKLFLPQNADIQIAEVDYYFFINDTAQGKKLLYKLPAESFDDVNSIINVTNLFILDSNYKKAEELLQKSYRNHQDNFIVLYNLGVVCYYISEKNFLEANQLEVKGNKNEAKPFKKESDDYLKYAETYFEKALSIQPDDLSVLNILKAIYIRMDSPKYDETIKKIEELENRK